MAALSINQVVPRKTISTDATPKAIRDAIHHIFSNCPERIWLVGGTALAGFYAEHRRSDDIDLFAADENYHRAAVLAVKSLEKLGAVFSREMQTPQFYRTDVSWQGHKFTIDVVLDENAHRIGRAFRSDDGALVADLNTLYSMKAACLVSRCSEKDIFDLDWIFSRTGDPDVADLISRGSAIDGGLCIETLLYSVKSAQLREDACHFFLPGSVMTHASAFKKILKLQKKLIRLLLEYERRMPVSPEADSLAKTLAFTKKISAARETPSPARRRRRRF